MGHNFRKLTTNIIEKAKDELGYGMNIGLRLSIFEKKIEKWMQCPDWFKNELKFWCEFF